VNPRQLRQLGQSRIQQLEESLAGLDHRTWGEKINDALKAAHRHLYAASNASMDRALEAAVRDELDRAAGSLRAIPAPETFMEGVGRVLREFAAEAEKIELVPDEATAHHEAGHLVVGYANGSTVGGLITCCEYRIEGKGLVWGFTEFAEHRSTDAHAMTLFAGPLAELRFKAWRTPARDFRFDPNYVPAWGDRLDYGRLLAPWDAQTEEEFGLALRLLGEVGRGKAFAALLSTTQKTLNCPNVWEAIERLAAELFRARTLRGDEAVAIIAPLVPVPPR
jgi:hypothetical protein